MVISMGQRVLRLCLENGHGELSLFSMRRRHCYVSISNLILYTWDLIWVDSRNSIWLYLYLCECHLQLRFTTCGQAGFVLKMLDSVHPMLERGILRGTTWNVCYHSRSQEHEGFCLYHVIWLRLNVQYCKQRSDSRKQRSSRQSLRESPAIYNGDRKLDIRAYKIKLAMYICSWYQMGLCNSDHFCHSSQADKDFKNTRDLKICQQLSEMKNRISIHFPCSNSRKVEYKCHAAESGNKIELTVC
ncbi:unnamed protein product [Albugo candida]|uniref:Uncharacterized protein n=1 Tax=Albugo candida TaxID=65357 RepID=A0A024FVZ5_9STRA|nr:unnamed protein product [Albugo candida]|eukprot:CCI11300.1 unnamed protein product [Albugo candida]